MTAPALPGLTVDRTPTRLRRPSYGRRIKARACPPAGAHAGMPAWWGRDRWLSVDLWCALAAGRHICREEHVDPATLVRIARAHAAHADHDTGRNCRPTNEILAAELGMSVRQIQRGRRVLIRFELLHVVERGRMYMRRDEWVTAWRRGSSHRQLAAEFALSSPRHPQGCPCSVDHVTPPGLTVGKPVSTVQMSFLSRKARASTDERRSAPRSPRKAPRTHSTGPHEKRTERLVTDLQRRLTWLSGVSPRRLSSLHRFARQGWTGRDVQTALDNVLVARKWRIPERVDNPAAYLAMLLRDVDPADRPGAIEEAMLAEELARREWVWQTTTGPACPHGQPGGNVPHPLDGHVACLDCRQAGRLPE